MTYSVHDEPDFARVYDEDEMIQVRKGDLRALLDLATGSLDFGSGFWNNEDTEIARGIAVMLGVDPNDVTPGNMQCTYGAEHAWWDWAPGEMGCSKCKTRRPATDVESAARYERD